MSGLADEIIDRLTVEQMLARLKPREADVISRHFGIGQGAETLREIADDLGRSVERVRQIESKGLRKLKYAFPYGPAPDHSEAERHIAEFKAAQAAERQRRAEEAEIRAHAAMVEKAMRERENLESFSRYMRSFPSIFVREVVRDDGEYGAIFTKGPKWQVKLNDFLFANHVELRSATDRYFNSENEALETVAAFGFAPQ